LIARVKRPCAEPWEVIAVGAGKTSLQRGDGAVAACTAPMPPQRVNVCVRSGGVSTREAVFPNIWRAWLVTHHRQEARRRSSPTSSLDGPDDVAPSGDEN